jgi:hypothetical protein
MPNAGQAFTGWSDGVMTAQRSDLDVTAHVTVQANFSAQQKFTVNPVIGANGSATPNAPQSVLPGATTFFDLTPNPGYRIGIVAVAMVHSPAIAIRPERSTRTAV